MLLFEGFPFSTDIQTLDISKFSKIFSFQYGKIQNSLCKMYETLPSHIFNRTIKLPQFKNGNRLSNRVKCPKDAV